MIEVSFRPWGFSEGLASDFVSKLIKTHSRIQKDNITPHFYTVLNYLIVSFGNRLQLIVKCVLLFLSS